MGHGKALRLLLATCAAAVVLSGQPPVKWTVTGLVSNYESEVNCGNTSLLPLDGFKLLVVRGRFTSAGAEKPSIDVPSIQISGPAAAPTPAAVGILTSKNICAGYRNIAGSVSGAVTTTAENQGFTLSREKGAPAVVTLTQSSVGLCFVFSVREAPPAPTARTLTFAGASAPVPAPK
jgi:hypothetical protein